MGKVDEKFQFLFGGVMHRTVHGGGGGIRTHGTVAGTTVFKTVSFDHSDTPPDMRHHLRGPAGRAIGDPPAVVSHRAGSRIRVDSGCSSILEASLPC
jgi:hypothetical protein